GRPHAVALRFVRCDQLTVGLSPTRVRPCRAHEKTLPLVRRTGFVGKPWSVPYYSSLEHRGCATSTAEDSGRRFRPPPLEPVIKRRRRAPAQLGDGAL